MLDRRPIGTSRGSPIYAGGSVWVASTDGSPSNREKIQIRGNVVDVVDGPPIQAAGDGSLWAVGDGSLVRPDPTSGEIEATIPSSEPPTRFRERRESVGDVMPWSSDPDLFLLIAGTAAVVRIDTTTDQVVGDPLSSTTFSRWRPSPATNKRSATTTAERLHASSSTLAAGDSGEDRNGVPLPHLGPPGDPR